MQKSLCFLFRGYISLLRDQLDKFFCEQVKYLIMDITFLTIIGWICIVIVIIEVASTFFV